ncbi:MAG TPA: hypothetical protein VGM82_10875 [Gemmatimonadaceae bacterium]|jgi:hypothetical protein
MAEPFNTSEQLAALADLDRLLRDHAVTYWVFGGWAVDFHVGRITRAHDDIDIAVWSDDRASVIPLLVGGGWSHRPQDGEDGYMCFARGDVQLEIAFLARDDSGVMYTPLDDGRGEWPPTSFGEDVACLQGTCVRVVSRASLIADKATIREDATTAAKDRADVARLRQTS